MYWLVPKSGPQCMVEPKDSGPPPADLGQPTLPLLSMMSIYPLAGHWPYSLQRGIIQMAGQSQSPLGNLALTSTLPNLREKELTVVNFPLMTGLMQWLPSLPLLQPQFMLPVHWSAGEPPQTSQVAPVRTPAAPILSSVRTGLMLSFPSWTKVVERLLSQSSNSQLPPPERVMSCLHLVKSSSSKLSSKTSLLAESTRRQASRAAKVLVDMCECQDTIKI